MREHHLTRDMPVKDASHFAGNDPVMTAIPAALFTKAHGLNAFQQQGRELEQIAKDGGLSAREIVGVLCGTPVVPGRQLGHWEAHKILRAMVETFRRGYRIGVGID